ncbi:TY-Chap2 family putative peptide chaperone [Arthrobacter sp. zg-Y895]|uniref:TY-Chap2 family putative peptide chaperone n=1 Tax=Arthrobacter sp. zg-Y895 TaxID=2886933 RepID=UPI003FA47EAA
MLVDRRGGWNTRRRGLGFAAFKEGRHNKIKWDRAFEMAIARQITLALETSVGIDLPDRAPKTIRRALSYRVLASIIEMTLGDDQSWTATPGKEGPLDPTCLIGSPTSWDGESPR